MAFRLYLDSGHRGGGLKGRSLAYAIGLHLTFLAISLVPFSRPHPAEFPRFETVSLVDIRSLPKTSDRNNREWPATRLAPVHPLSNKIPDPSKPDLALRDRKVAENSGLVRLLRQTRAGAIDQILDKTGAFREPDKDNTRTGSSPALAEENVPAARRGQPSLGIGKAPTTLSRSAENVPMAGRRTVTIDSPLKMDSAVPGTGGRSLEEIKKVLDDGKGAIEILYKQALAEQPALQGTITIEFVIAADGVVSSCRAVGNTTGDEPLKDALARRIRHLKFQPIPNGQVTVTFPFVFYPGN